MVSRRLLKLEKYQKRLKRLLNKDIIDIIIFGSFAKSGNSNDVDLALVAKGKIDRNALKKKIRLIIKEKVDLQVISLDSIYSSLWLTLIKEGFSISKNKYLSDIYKVEPKVLYKYSLKKLTNVQKVQFERGIKNVLQDKGTYLTRSVILVPLNIKNEVVDFLKTWNIYYESQEYELLPVMRKEEFL